MVSAHSCSPGHLRNARAYLVLLRGHLAAQPDGQQGFVDPYLARDVGLLQLVVLDVGLDLLLKRGPMQRHVSLGARPAGSRARNHRHTTSIATAPCALTLPPALTFSQRAWLGGTGAWAGPMCEVPSLASSASRLGVRDPRWRAHRRQTCPPTPPSHQNLPSLDGGGCSGGQAVNDGSHGRSTRHQTSRGSLPGTTVTSGMCLSAERPAPMWLQLKNKAQLGIVSGWSRLDVQDNSGGTVAFAVFRPRKVPPLARQPQHSKSW